MLSTNGVSEPACVMKAMKVQTARSTLMSVLNNPVKTVGSVTSAQIRLTGSWTGSSASQMQRGIYASVSQGLLVSKTKERNL